MEILVRAGADMNIRDEVSGGSGPWRDRPQYSGQGQGQRPAKTARVD